MATLQKSDVTLSVVDARSGVYVGSDKHLYLRMDAQGGRPCGAKPDKPSYMAASATGAYGDRVTLVQPIAEACGLDSAVWTDGETVSFKPSAFLYVRSLVMVASAKVVHK